MTLKEYLNRGFALRQKIYMQKEQLESISETLTQLGASLDGVKVIKTPTTSCLENGVVRMVELENDLQKSLEELTKVGDEISTVISLLDDFSDQRLMIKRYIGFKSWDSIAEEMGLTCKGAQNKHYLALQKLEVALNGSPLMEVIEVA